MSSRSSAAKVARWLVSKEKRDDAVAVLCAWAASGGNDKDGQELLAEAYRIDPGSQLAQLAFERMEGIPAQDHALLDEAIKRWSAEEIAKLEKQIARPNQMRAQVGFNNNVKYNGSVFHIQTEDSGLDRPHIITHLFADGGRILKSNKRSYANEVKREDIAQFVRALMKGQHMEMAIMLREGRFDDVIAGRAVGGMTLLEEPPRLEIQKLATKKETRAEAPPASRSVPPGALSADASSAGTAPAEGGAAAPAANAPPGGKAAAPATGASARAAGSANAGGPAALANSLAAAAASGGPGAATSGTGAAPQKGEKRGPNAKLGGDTAPMLTPGAPPVGPPPPPARLTGAIPKVVVKAPVKAPQKPKFRLTVQRSLGGGPATYEPTEELVILGSEGAVSLKHERFCHPREAELRWVKGRLWLRDLDPGNGVFLRIVQPVELEIGDEFIVGDQLLTIERNPEPNDGPDEGPTYFYSSPKWTSSFRVVQIFERGAKGACVVARGTTMQIGAVVGDFVFTGDPLVDDQHCLVEEQAGAILLTDLGSRAGVFVRIKGEQELVTGDEIMVGRTRLIVEVFDTKQA